MLILSLMILIKRILIKNIECKYHFYMSETSILEDHHCEKTFKKYLFNQKIQPEVDHRLTPKNSENQPFSRSTSQISKAISFDWINIFWKFFHSDDLLRLKIHLCKNGIYSIILQGVDFFLLHFSSSFLIFFKIFSHNNIPLTVIFSTRTKSLSNSNPIKSYKHLKIYWQLIWNRL